MLENLPKYAVNHYLCPTGVSLETFADTVASAGFDGIGLTEAALAESQLADRPVSALRHLLAERGLSVSSVNTAGFFLSDDPAQSERNTRLLEAAAGLAPAALNIIVGAGDLALPLEAAREQAEAGLARYAERARQAGVQLIVEPMWVANAFGKSCFHSIAQVEAVFSRIPGLKLNLDYYHLWCDPDLGRVLRGQGCEIGLLQICDVDWPQTPNQAVRAPLGEGKLPVLGQLADMQRIPGAYPIELELFINQLPGRDYAELIRSAARQLNLN